MVQNADLFFSFVVAQNSELVQTLNKYIPQTMRGEVGFCKLDIFSI